MCTFVPGTIAFLFLKKYGFFREYVVYLESIQTPSVSVHGLTIIRLSFKYKQIYIALTDPRKMGAGISLN
jgi:hypothetical protein